VGEKKQVLGQTNQWGGGGLTIGTGTACRSRGEGKTKENHKETEPRANLLELDKLRSEGGGGRVAFSGRRNGPRPKKRGLIRLPWKRGVPQDFRPRPDIPGGNWNKESKRGHQEWEGRLKKVAWQKNTAASTGMKSPRSVAPTGGPKKKRALPEERIPRSVYKNSDALVGHCKEELRRVLDLQYKGSTGLTGIKSREFIGMTTEKG